MTPFTLVLRVILAFDEEIQHEEIVLADEIWRRGREIHDAQSPVMIKALIT